MPRFNFSAYVARNSLTDFSDHYDLHPQEEWESKHKIKTVSVQEEPKTSAQDPAEDGSTCSSDLERSLHDEVGNLTQEMSEFGDEFLDPVESAMFSPITSPIQTPVRDSGLETFFEDSQVSRNTKQDERITKTSTPMASSKQPKPDPVYTTVTTKKSPKSSPKQSPKQPREIPVSEQKQDTISYNEEECRQALWSTVNAKPSEGQGYLLMTLDDIGALKPVKKMEDIQEIFEEVGCGMLPPPSKEVQMAIKRIKTMPLTTAAHYTTVGSYVNHLYQEEKLTDVVVRIGNQCFYGHRVIMASYSLYFDDLFKNPENNKSPAYIRLRGICPKAFKTFMDFIYTGQLNITPDVIGDLIVLSDLLKVATLRSKCSDFMEEISVEQALILLAKGKLKPETELFDFAVNSIFHHFTDLYKRDVFLQIDLKTLCLILDHDYLKITSEYEVFEAGLRWIASSLHERQQHIEEVMECVRFPYMTQKELFECMKVTDLLRTNEACQRMVLEANWIVSAWKLRIDEPMNMEIRGPRMCFAEDYNASEDLFYSTTSLPTVQVEVQPDSQQTTPRNEPSPVSSPRSHKSATPANSPRSQKSPKSPNQGARTPTGATSGKEAEQPGDTSWMQFSNTPEPQYHHAATMFAGKIYMTGGTGQGKGGVASKQAFVMDLRTREWKPIAPMLTARSQHSICAFLGMIYVVGGLDQNKKVQDTVECYNPTTDKWFYVKSMSVARAGAGINVFDGKMFVAGGYGNPTGVKSVKPLLSSVESFDPRKNAWTTQNDLRFPRCHTDLVTVNGQMFICGGLTRKKEKDSVLSSVSSLDIYKRRSDTWEFHTDMVVPRHSPGITIIDNRIYIVGGMSTVMDSALTSIECFDVARNRWINDVKELPYQAKWLCSVAVPERRR